MFHFLRHKWTAISTQKMTKGFIWTEDSRMSPCTIVTYKCTECKTIRQDTLDGWVDLEDLE